MALTRRGRLLKERVIARVPGLRRRHLRSANSGSKKSLLVVRTAAFRLALIYSLEIL